MKGGCAGADMRPPGFPLQRQLPGNKPLGVQGHPERVSAGAPVPMSKLRPMERPVGQPALHGLGRFLVPAQEQGQAAAPEGSRRRLPEASAQTPVGSH